MYKNSKKSKSLLTTQILTIPLIIFLVASLFVIPTIGEWYSSVEHATALRPTDGADAKIGIMVTLYLAEIPALTAVIAIWKLLSNITIDKIFTQGNVKILRILSYCCFSVTLIFIYFSIFTPVSLAISFASAFMGLILRVLKNVFEQAVILREENDFTI